LYLPTLATDLTRRRSRVDRSRPILLSRLDHQRELVAACCRHAERSGVRAGMTVSQAKALLRGSVHKEPWDGVLLAKALRWLAESALRFTPKVALDAPDGLWLDATGCTHLYGGTLKMAEKVVGYFRRVGFEGRVAAAPFLGAAWALARFGGDRCCCVTADQVAAALSPLPVAALRLSVEQQQALGDIGIESIGQLLDVPRAELARRYGGDVPRRVDQALGRDLETITPIRTRPPLAVGRMFAGPTDRPESIALCVRQLLKALCLRLERREAGCRELLLVLMRSDLSPVEILVRASNPVRDAMHWYTLLMPHLERVHLGYGVEGVTITARGLRTLRHEQASRWIDLTQTTNTGELARLTDTLMARLGPDHVLRMRPRASFIPERSCAFETVEAPGTGAVSNLPSPRVDRPSLLLPRPVPVEVVFLFPDGPIGYIRRDGESRRVVRCRGPERIGGEWWLREPGTRDYYQVHTDDGTWLWVFRACETGRWFVHGEWA
jgi:protein ImuB